MSFQKKKEIISFFIGKKLIILSWSSKQKCMKLKKKKLILKEITQSFIS